MIDRFVICTGLISLLVATSSALATGIVTKILRHRAILDRPNDRSSHSVPTPRGGGWGLMSALLPAWIWAVWRAGRLHDPAELLLLAGALALIAVSWVDDRRTLGAAPRFLTQIAAVGLVMATLPADLSLSDGLLPPIFDRLVAGMVWLWFVNLFNFMDGIDGITGGSAAAMGFGVMLVSLRYGPSELDAFRGAMIAAAGLGFLWWNWHPAKVFMGDVGSIPLGYLLGYELIRLAMDRGQVFALIIPLYYLTDATITLVRRGLRGERVWRAHREHFYQRSVQLGRSHSRTAKTAISFQLALAIFAWFAALFGSWWLIPSILLVGLLLRRMSRPPRPA